MACRRSISTRATLLTRRFHASISHILHYDDDDDNRCRSPDLGPSQPAISNFLQRRFHNNSIGGGTAGFAALFRERKCSAFSLPQGLGSSFFRNMSSTIGEGSDKIDYIGDVAEVFTEKTVEAVASQAPAVSEVAVAAADSFFLVAGLQYLIDGVHSFTGLNWWASIALTTILIRGATIPLLINQLKATSKLNLMRPHLEDIKQQMQDMAMDPKAVADGRNRMNALFKEYGVTPFTPLKGLFIQGPIFISFFLAITNMVEKVPSFKHGGAFWFTDLTTPDSLYIFPVLASLSFLITVECNMQEGLEGNPVAGTMKNFSRILAVLAIPFTMGFPKALFCYWVTSNLFSLTYGLVLKRPEVKKFLGLPEAPVPPTTAPQSKFSVFSAFKQYNNAVKPEPSLPTEPSKFADRRLSSSSVISQRLRSLEKQVKGRKKQKKR